MWNLFIFTQQPLVKKVQYFEEQLNNEEANGTFFQDFSDFFGWPNFCDIIT